VLWAVWSARSALAVGLASALGCGGPPEVVVLAAMRAPPAEGEFPDDSRALLRFHSQRFKLSIPLPDGRAWKIDDHHDRALLARHAPTRSTLTVLTFTEPELMSRQKCMDRAMEMGLLALHDPLTIEDKTTIGPEAFDTRIWIALEARASPTAALTGHALLIGGYIRKCLFVHYATEVASEKEEPLLTSRLAVARLRILGGIQLEPFDEAPRAKAPDHRPGADP
jgi:hypothetical protein